MVRGALLAVFAAGLVAGLPVRAATLQTITDASGTKVTVPTAIHAIGDSWPAHVEVVTMLGAGSKIASYVDNDTPAKLPWLALVNPQMRRAIPAFTKVDVNVEEMLRHKPDVVFTMVTPRLRTRLADLGIPDIALQFSNYAQLKQTFDITAQVLGPEAERRAAAFDDYLDTTLAALRAKTATLPENEKPRVLHVVQLHPLTIDGGDSIIDAWIQAAGGINVAHAIHGSLKVTSKEQLLAWNPDVVIFGSTALPDPATRAKELAALAQDPLWANIDAVKEHRLYINPNGGYLWDRYSAETVLQLQWAAKLLHPELFGNIDMVAATKAFYRRFLDYPLSDAQAQEILHALPPRQP